MSSALEKADSALLWVVIGVVVLVAFGIIGTIISTIVFAVKVIIVVAAIGIGWRVATAITSGARRRELNR